MTLKPSRPRVAIECCYSDGHITFEILNYTRKSFELLFSDLAYKRVTGKILDVLIQASDDDFLTYQLENRFQDYCMHFDLLLNSKTEV